MSLSLSHLRALVAVVDHAGFAAAADELSVTQSAVSHAISALEAELGSAIFTRRPKLMLTRVGTEILPHARAALASAAALVTAAAKSAGSLSGVVRLGAPSTVCFGLIPQLLTSWQAAFPAIDVTVFEGEDEELPDWLERGQVDAAILINPPQVAANAIVIGSDNYCAVVRDDHPLAAQPQLSALDVSEDPILISTGSCGKEVTSIFKAAGIALHPAQRVQDNAALLKFVAAGLGVAVFPSIASAMLPKGTKMLDLVPLRKRTFVFSGPHSRPQNPLVSALQSALQDALNQHPAGR